MAAPATARQPSASATRPSNRPADKRSTSEQRALQRRAQFEVHRRAERRIRFVPSTALVGLVLVAALSFGALATHISLINRQMRLDAIRSEIVALRTSNRELRQEQSRLQSPDEIRSLATGLGLVEHGRPEPLTPAQRVIGLPVETDPSSAPSSAPSNA